MIKKITETTFTVEGVDYICTLTYGGQSVTLPEIEPEPVIEYTVNEEQWNDAFDLYWKNLTYVVVDSHERTTEIKLLEDGGVRQYGEYYGTFYCYNRNNRWEYYIGLRTTPDAVYETAEDYIENNYTDSLGTMKNVLPKLIGKMSSFAYNTDEKAYYGSDIQFAIVPGGTVYDFDIVAKFENHNLSYFILKYLNQKVVEVSFSNYGNTVIDFPSYIINPSNPE